MSLTEEGRRTLRDVFLRGAPNPSKALALIGRGGGVIARVPIEPSDWTLGSFGLEVRKPFENSSGAPWVVVAVALMGNGPLYLSELRQAVRVQAGQIASFALDAP